MITAVIHSGTAMELLAGVKMMLNSRVPVVMEDIM